MNNMEDDKLELKDGSIWIMDNIKNDLQRIYDHYRDVVQKNEYLREENSKLKSEAYKDDELSKMKSKYDSMREDYFRGFPITKEEEDKINEWKKTMIKEHPANTGAIGGRFSYKFLVTGIGVAGKIVDEVSGKEFEFKELY